MPFHFSFPPIKVLDIKSSSTGRKVTLAVTIALLVIFIWSVVLGNSRRQKADFIKEVAQASKGIQTTLSEAEDIRIEDPIKALKLVGGAENSYKTLTQKAQEKKYIGVSELTALGNAINTARLNIKKAEQSPSKEFYDLSLIKADAEATKLYMADRKLAMLDSSHGRVYILSIDDKSVETVSSKDIKGAQFVALHQNNPIVFNGASGIFKKKDDKVERVVEKDSAWKNVVDMGVFNGNIYLLVAGNNEVYKYLVAENGYGDKTSYFKTGQTENLSGAVGMSIDSAVYIAKNDSVKKYVSGLHETFETTVPEDKPEFSSIYTSAELQNVYLMDKDHATIFIFDKEGVFQKQVESAIIAQADDFVVDEEKGILILAENKIFNIKQNN